MRVVTLTNRVGHLVNWDLDQHAMPDGYDYAREGTAHGPTTGPQSFNVRTENGMIVTWSTSEPLRVGCVDLEEEALEQREAEARTSEAV